MIINDINYPNQLLDALKDGSLVIFAGAGVSVDPPTSLPDFEKLAKELSEGTEYTLKKDDSCEVFLGMLKSKGVPVNELAAEILSKTCVEHNKLHEAIINLFPDTRNIKIVTTNYDQMFEHVLASKSLSAVVYDVPALPLGNDVNGIIHIHGNVNNPVYMVLTDEDFGRAYLTEGYASRFLVQLFESYTVLFVGYSYKDTILRYLTRAMSRNNAGKKYILTDDKKVDWHALGIEPVRFPKRKFAVMRESLVKLGVIVKKGLVDWKTYFSAISDAPPLDLTIETEIDYMLENIERARVLSLSVYGKGWVPFLDKKHVFEGCFSNIDGFSEQDLIWANWLCDNLIGKEDDTLLKLILKHNNQFNKEFISLLADKLVNNKTLKDEYFKQYIVLIEGFLTNSWAISRLIEETNRRDLLLLGFELYKKLFDIRMILQKRWFIKESLDYTHVLSGEYYETQHLWSLIKEIACRDKAYDVLSFAQGKMKEVYNRYLLVNQSPSSYVPWEITMIDIENYDEGIHRADILNVLVKMYLDASISLQGQSKELLKTALVNDLQSESYLLKKVSLKAIRITDVFNCSEKLNFLIDFDLIDYSHPLKEQTFLLASEIFNGISNDEKDRLIDAIDSIKDDTQAQTYEYKKYNWFVWLSRIDENNDRLKELISYYENEFGFKPREHPEQTTESYDEVLMPDKSPLTEDELKTLSAYDAVKYLVDFKENPFEGSYRYGLLSVLTACVSKDYSWTKLIIKELVDKKISNEEIWQHIFYGLYDSMFPMQESVDLLVYLSTAIEDWGFDAHLANLLFNILRRNEIKDTFSEYETKLYSVSEIVWNKRKRKKHDFGRLIDATLNTMTGTVILSWIYMVSYQEEAIIPSCYKDRFEQALRLRSWEKNVAVCVLAGHFNFLLHRDKDWCINSLVPLLTGKDKKSFASAWEGIAYFSRRINKDTVDVVLPMFSKAIKHLDWLEDEAKSSFIELLLTLLIYVVDKPTLRFIPNFYKYASEEDTIEFIKEIRFRLKKMDDNDVQNWWNNWLKHFLENRKRNKPVVLSDKEKKAILELVIELDSVFAEAVSVICKGAMPSTVDSLFWISFKEKHLVSKYPHETAFLITRILNTATIANHDKLYIREIIDEIKELDDKEQKLLQEAQLRKNIL